MLSTMYDDIECKANFLVNKADNFEFCCCILEKWIKNGNEQRDVLKYIRDNQFPLSHIICSKSLTIINHPISR